jgi:anti-sigma-K factor RskA
MSCSSDQLKDYFFGELGAEERFAVEQHVAVCSGCREDLNTLALTRGVLLSIPDEEPPRRIAFVSDKVFEPRWWQKLWTSGPQLGFASACVLAVAILVHGYAPGKPQSQPQTAPAVAGIDQAYVDAAVARAVAASQQLQTAELLSVINSRLQRSEREQQAELVAVKDFVWNMHKQNALVRHTAYYPVSAGAAQ